jgi:hypothetical protein
MIKAVELGPATCDAPRCCMAFDREGIRAAVECKSDQLP